ncbi:hypothetical protein PHYSODRAFT_255426 [Phytophthora sojae]|uniref:Uncharacterized protein n=1 Tax=Phytophthora sojae (strain P6497) TaxID=1094619 RepID=G4ZIZ6_PHYSP|nr:hypothetical protein PHYSODRAFT_255426 [Phytophthora sojae]EGZ18801.1 hypothetical protein PHYSODRAFT_255426 [Phytophthora sojae]|eukprot:XP_009527859.1 hypothetical protein PHYSODRAFT_255426 [Phytophthora sojae]
MGSTIEERNLLAGVQTGEAPGCTLSDLPVLMQETAIKGVGSRYFGGSRHLNLQGRDTCILHGLGMLFVGASEPFSYVFPLVPHEAASDLPGEKAYSHDEAILYWENLEVKAEPRNEPPTKRVRGRPTVFKYINDIITMVYERQAQASAPLPATLTAGLSSHSLCRGSAAYANTSPQLAIQRISTRGAWLLDSLTKAFEYLCKNASGFTDTTPNVDALVLDAALASLLIHLDDIATASQQEQAATGFTSHYLYRFHNATNVALGARLSLDSYIGWGRQLRTAWQTENFGQLGERSNGNATILATAVTQMLSSIAAMQRTLQKLVAVHESKSASADGPAPCRCDSQAPQATTDTVVEAHSLAGCFYNW